jgi:hypothetical protein
MEGRIDQWQPRRRQQRRKRNTKTVSVKKNGGRESVPQSFLAPIAVRSLHLFPSHLRSPQCCAVAFYTSQAPAVTCSECRLLTRCTKGLIPEKPCLARDFTGYEKRRFSLRRWEKDVFRWRDKGCGTRKSCTENQAWARSVQRRSSQRHRALSPSHPPIVRKSG